MPDEDYSDDYVASLLASDARNSTVRYAQVGLSGLLPRQPRTNVAKPNTKFLKNLIRETDGHNAALLAREAEESRARLKALKKEQFRGRDEVVSSPRRRRLEEDEHDYDRRRKRREFEDDTHERSCRSRSIRENTRRERRPPHRSLSSSDESREKRYSGRHDESVREKVHHRSLRRHSRDRRKSHRDFRDHEVERRSNRSQRHRSRSPQRNHKGSRRRRHSSSVSDSDQSLAFTRHHRAQESSHPKHSDQRSKREVRADSDPLEELVGPLPPPPPPPIRKRGRGAFSNSTMDTHFANDYDPSVDVQPDEEKDGDDWEEALEVLRDRQHFKQGQALRLLSAGFTEAQVKQWEKGGEKNEEDVTWKRHGEGREWDRGKVVDDEGRLKFEPDWK